MLIVALVLAVIGLASLVTAVVTGNELIAWVCIGAAVLGVILLIVDAIRERQTRSVAAVETASDDAVAAPPATVDNTYENFDAEYPDEGPAPAAETTAEAAVEAAVESDAEAGAEPVEELEPADEGADADGQTEVEYVSADDSPDDADSQTPVHVGEDEPDTSIERVTEDDPAEKLEDK